MPDEPEQSGFIQSVRWQLPQDIMTISSRDLVEVLPESWAAIPEAVTWANLPTVTWANYESSIFEEV